MEMEVTKWYMHPDRPCRDRTAEFFLETLPIRSGRRAPALRAAKIAQLKSECAQCPVLEQCRAEALDHSDTWSIRGGMTPEERIELRLR